MTLGRSFLLWLLGVLVVTMVVVSALVLWHEQQILEDELRSRADMLAHVLALAAADGGSPEYLAIFSMTDIRAGEVRDHGGGLLWRFGPPPEQLEALDTDLLRVERRVEVRRGPWGGEDSVDVVVLVSRARMRAILAAAAARLLAGLGIALSLALVAGLALIGRVVGPLNQLAEWVRSFDPDGPVELAVEGGPTSEVRDLARAFSEMGRRLAEQRRSLVASELQFRGLFVSSPTPLLRLDRNLSLRDANPAAEPYLGGPVARASALSLAAFIERPSEKELASAAAAATASETVLEAVWRLPGGELAEVELRIGASGDGEAEGLLVAVHDLTDRVRRMGEHWRRTFDAMVDGVALVDRDGVVVLANQALAPHLEVVGGGLPRRLRDGAPRHWRVRNVGRLLDCSLALPEGLEHAILVVRDVTEAADAEDRLRDAEKMHAVGTLASGVAHDFNNLLAAIMLHVRLLQRQPEAAEAAVAAIGDLAEQGTEVVRELLFFARRESSIPVTIDLVDLVRHQENVLRHLLPDGIGLAVELENETVPIVADAVGLRRLLLNLVINARDALEGRGGRITVRVEHTAGRAVLEVADDGPGVPPEVREHIFEPFFTLRRQGRGSGLGLAVVYSIVTSHGGEVDVLSAPGEGARFVVRLPLGDPAAVEPVDGRATAEAPIRVLLVEGNGRSAARTIETLAAAGLEVRHAPVFEAVDGIVDRWTPSVAVVAEDVLGGATGWMLSRLQLPVLLVGGSVGGGGEDWGPRVIRLGSEATPGAILEALRDLSGIVKS
jgi:signal transduction histidine kinase